MFKPSESDQIPSAEKKILECLDSLVWTSDFAVAHSLLEQGTPEADRAFDVFSRSNPSRSMRERISISSYDRLQADQMLRASHDYDFMKADLEETVLQFRERFRHSPSDQMASQVLLCDIKNLIDSDSESYSIRYWEKHQDLLQGHLSRLKASFASRLGFAPSLKKYQQWEAIKKQAIGYSPTNTETDPKELREWLNLLNANMVTDCRNSVFFRLKCV